MIVRSVNARIKRQRRNQVWRRIEGQVGNAAKELLWDQLGRRTYRRIEVRLQEFVYRQLRDGGRS